MERSPNVWMALQIHRSFLGSPLLPNLKRFESFGNQEDLFSVAIFLPPTLERILISPRGDRPWTQAFLSYFPNVSPKVEHIRIFSGLSTEPVDIRPLLGCIHLRSLAIHGLRVPTVEFALKFAELPHLEDLSLSFIQHPAPTNPSPYQSNPAIFHRVKSLECSSSPEFLQACRFPVLQSFSISDAFRIRDSLDALWKHCSPNILSRVSIVCFGLDRVSLSLTLEDIRKVFSFHRLEHVTIETPLWIWNDQALELMALAWPGLRELSVHYLGPFRQDLAGFKLLGLAHLAKHCPQLRSLSIQIRGQNPSITLSDLPEDGSSNFHLESISFTRARMKQSQCEIVAAFLSCLFPNLRRIDMMPFDGSDRWKRVEGLLKVFGAVRAYGQRR